MELLDYSHKDHKIPPEIINDSYKFHNIQNEIFDSIKLMNPNFMISRNIIFV